MTPATSFLAPLNVINSSNASTAYSGTRHQRLCFRHGPIAALDESASHDAATVAPPAGCPAHHSPASPTLLQSNRANLRAGAAPTDYRVYPDGFPANIKKRTPRVYRTIPAIGFLLDFLIGISPRDRARKMGDIYTSSGFQSRMHIITDYNAINELVPDTATFINKGASPVINDFFGENNAFNLDGPDIKSHRAKLAPAFSPQLFPFYADRIRVFAEEAWKKMSHKTMVEGEIGLLDDMIREMYLATTIDFVNGIGFTPDEYIKLRELYSTISDGWLSPSFTRTYKNAILARDEILVIVEGVIRRMLAEDGDLITELREYGDKVLSKGRKDILRGKVSMIHVWSAASAINVSPEAENDPEVVRGIAMVSLGLWFAGMSTAAVTTSCALMEMGFDKSIWGRLVEEQDAIVRTSGNGNRKVKYEQFGDMKLLDSFLEEILRVFSPALGIFRIADNDCEVFGKKIEKGSKIFFDILAAHMDERYYEDPDKIVIDRFLNGSVPPVLSFGAKGSAHYCLGAGLSKVLMKTTLSILLREYTMDMDEHQARRKKIPVPDAVPKSKVAITALKPRFDDKTS